MVTEKEKVETKNNVKNATDAYKELYVAAYDKLDTAVIALNADFSKAVVNSKELLQKSQTEIERLHKKNASDIAAADKKLEAEKSEVAKAIAVAKETFTKESAGAESVKKEAIAASKNRIAKAAETEKKAKETANKNKDTKSAAAVKANEEIKNKAAKADAEEVKRYDAVLKSRAAANKNIEDTYAKASSLLETDFDKDVAALNSKINSEQTKYNDTVKNKTQVYNKSCADKKAKFDATMAELTKQSQSADKVTAKDGLKKLKTTQKEYDKDAKVSAAAFNADLADLKVRFVASLPPIEHTIFLRTNRYRIDCLNGDNIHVKAVNKSAYEEVTETEVNALNSEKCKADHEIDLAGQKHVEFCDASDYALETAIADFATETFNAGEECKKSELNLNYALSIKKSEIKRQKTEQDNVHKQNLASIENEFAKLNSDAGTHYNHLVSELSSLFDSFSSYYSTLNKFNGTSPSELANIAASFVSACSDTKMSEENAYSLYCKAVDVCNRDCEKQNSGVLDEKLSKVAEYQKNALLLAKMRYDNEKASLNEKYNNKIASENADHASKISNLDGELAAFENKTKSDIAAAQALMNSTIADINKRTEEFKARDQKARRDSENEKKSFVQKKNDYLKKLNDDKRAREAAKLSNMNSAAAALDANLATLKTSIEAEKKGENIMHSKLTEKTIKSLVKGCEIKQGTRWWVVDFSKK